MTLHKVLLHVKKAVLRLGYMSNTIGYHKICVQDSKRIEYCICYVQNTEAINKNKHFCEVWIGGMVGQDFEGRAPWPR